MNALKYAQEFTWFVSRWTKPVVNEDGSSTPPLTNQQLFNATQDVLKVMLGSTYQLQDYSSVQTPTMKIAVCTPNAPFVQKCNLELLNTSLGRSLDTLTALTEDSADKPKVDKLMSKSQEKLDVESNSENKWSPNEKKFISRSSPAIHVTSVGRSGTFVRDEDANKETVNQTGTDAILEKGLDPYNLEKMVKKIDNLRVSASDFVSKLDGLRKDFLPQQTKPIRRLSSIGMNRSTTLLRPVPPPKLRRSASGFTGTPTSSKLSTTEKDSVTTRRKSIVMSSLPVKQAKLSPTNSSSSVESAKKFPLAVGKPLKNPKYAHVQSTIRKTVTTKKST